MAFSYPSYLPAPLLHNHSPIALLIFSPVLTITYYPGGCVCGEKCLSFSMEEELIHYSLSCILTYQKSTYIFIYLSTYNPFISIFSCVSVHTQVINKNGFLLYKSVVI